MDWSKACLLAEMITGNGREAIAANTSAFARAHRTIAPNIQFEQSEQLLIYYNSYTKLSIIYQIIASFCAF